MYLADKKIILEQNVLFKKLVHQIHYNEPKLLEIKLGLKTKLFLISSRLTNIHSIKIIINFLLINLLSLLLELYKEITFK